MPPSTHMVLSGQLDYGALADGVGHGCRLLLQGYSICLVFLKLFERVYSPLTAGLLQPYRADSKLQDDKRTRLDRLYQKIVDDLDDLLHAIGLKAA